MYMVMESHLKSEDTGLIANERETKAMLENLFKPDFGLVVLIFMISLIALTILGDNIK